MPARRVLLALLLLLTPAFAEEESEYVYDLRLMWYHQDERGLHVIGTVRKGGEVAGQRQFFLGSSSPWGPLIAAKIAADEIPYCYFRVRTKSPLPFPLVTLMGNTQGKGASMTTAEVEADRRANDVFLNKVIQSFPETDILSLEEITQNQYLNVSPRKVSVPEDAK